MTGGPQINAEKITILINSKVSLDDQIWILNNCCLGDDCEGGNVHRCKLVWPQQHWQVVSLDT